MKLWNLQGIALVLVTNSPLVSPASLQAPPIGDPSLGAPSQPHENAFFLRVNAPGEPWHKRHLVQLPTTQYLGLENFTVHPTTPPLLFYPLMLEAAIGRLALLVPDVGDDRTKVPWIAAVKDCNTVTVAMKVIELENPDAATSGSHPGECPEGYECEADGWFAAEGPEGGFKDFAYRNFSGVWSPYKDADAEGWHVYYETEGPGHPLALELVPAVGIASW